MTRDEVLSSLPREAALTASFGNPGCGGYVEIFRTPIGERYEIANGPFDAAAPFVWTFRVLEKPT